MATVQEPAPAPAPRKKAALKTYWEKACLSYDASLEKADAEYAQKHSHWWNRRKEKHIERPPSLNSAKDFEAELTRRQRALKSERKKGHAIFGTLRSLAGPVEVIGGQASGIVGLVFPATPVIFGAVMYLFNAGNQVSDSFDTLETLFKECHDAIVQVNSLVENVRVLSAPLQDHVIETLVSVLEVFKIASKFAADGRLKAYAMALAGAGGPEKASLENMKNLAKKRVATVVIDTLAAVDRADAKGDVRHKETGDLIASVKIEISGEIKQVQQMLVESKEKGGGTKTARKETKDAKQKAEDRAKRDLETFLKPDKEVSGRIEEILKTTAAGTCDWVTKDPVFENWAKSSNSPLLWIFGSPGVGKSYLAARLVRYFGKSHLLGDKETETAKVAAYFCEYDDTDMKGTWDLESESKSEENVTVDVPLKPLPEDLPTQDIKKPEPESFPVSHVEEIIKQLEPESFPVSHVEKIIFTPPRIMNKSDMKVEAIKIKEEESDTDGETGIFPITLLHTLCWQLAEDDKNYRKYLIDHFDNVRNMAAESQPLDTVWESLFRNAYFSGLKDRFIVCIIDGLDNVKRGDRETLYGFFNNVVRDAESPGSVPIKFIILSQPRLQNEVLETEPGLQFPEIFITHEKNRNDIITSISTTIQRSPKILRVLKDERLRSDTITKLADSTGGIFEMSALILKELTQKDHVDLFTNVLHNPPKNIRNILEQTLTHFGETHTSQDIQDFNCMLAWVLYGTEYMTLSQLNAAVGLESEHGEFLDIRDKIEREFSAYFSIVDVQRDDRIDPASQAREDTESVKSHDAEQDPEESGLPFDPDLDLPTVRISHASIAKFFRSPRTALNSDKGIVIGMTIEDAHLRLAKTCLRVICTIETPQQSYNDLTESANKLLSYAALNFHKHLAQARGSASLGDKVEVFRLLTKVFHDEAVIARWVRGTTLYPDWFDLDGACGTVWAWFSDPEVLTKLEEKEKAWVVEPEIPVTEKILKPVAVWFARKWLQDPDIELNEQAFYFFLFLTGFLKLFERSRETTESTPGDHPFEYIQDMKPEDIIEVAEWSNFPKTALWHTRVGYNIDDAIPGLAEEYLEQYKIAIALDPNFGQAFYALAVGHSDRGNYDLAITEMEESRRLKYNIEGDSDRHATVLIAKWQEQRADTREARDEALETLEDGLKRYPENFEIISIYIEIAGKASRYRDIVSKLATLGTKLPDFLRSEWASNLHKIIRKAAQRLKRVGILKKSYEAAIGKSKKDPNIRLELLEALALLYAENQEADQAIKIYEMLVDAAEECDMTYRAASANEKISILLFLGAWNLGGTAAERETYLNKLIQLEKSEEHPSDSGAVSEINYFYGLQIGLYYRLNKEDEKAKPYFKARIERAMELLDDDDADNDEEAWGLLRDTLYKIGEPESGKTAGGLYQKEWLRMMNMDEKEREQEVENNNEETNAEAESLVAITSTARTETQPSEIPNELTEKETVKETTQPQNTSLAKAENQPVYVLQPWITGWCDGVCDRDMTIYDRGIWICVHCINTWFCTDCYEKHKENEIPFIVCDSDHEFNYQMGAPKGLKADQVVVEGKVRDKWEWLDEIRGRWGLPLKKEMANKHDAQVTDLGKA